MCALSGDDERIIEEALHEALQEFAEFASGDRTPGELLVKRCELVAAAIRVVRHVVDEVMGKDDIPF